MQIGCPAGRTATLGAQSGDTASLLAGKTMGLLAVVGIAGVTGAIGVLVMSEGASARRVEHAPARQAVEPGPRPRPKLTTTGDVRTTVLHRAHLTAADRIDCAGCHDLRAEDFRAPPDDTCLGCHRGHGAAVHGTAPEAACRTCHDFLARDEATARARPCTSCHDTAQGSHAAIVIHQKQDCLACHPVHPRRDEPPPCVRCHDRQATRHPAPAAPARTITAGRTTGGAASRASGTTECQVCHLPHRPARQALARCQECHVDGAGDLPAAARIPATALFRGHDRCLACHAEHGFSRATVKACRDCHAGKHVLASEKVAKHAACTSCHDPHAARLPAVARCAACHPAVATSSKHPHDPAGRDCLGCHPPHQDLGASRAVLGCTDRCHGDKRSADHGTLACGECHPRHRFVAGTAAPALCLSCHATAIGHAPAIATSAGHASCTNCHASAAHRPKAARPGCGTCHPGEASAVPAGHAECKKCHDVHSGKHPPGAARCESCHADRARTPHVRVAGGCQACHRPHGPSGPATPPPCAQCHAAGSLTGLHAAPSHRNCATCHLAHAPAIAGREPCLRCHVDRRDHAPAARLCQACHPFGASPR